jgi:hypothetical protein
MVRFFVLNFTMLVYVFLMLKVIWCNWLKLSFKVLLLYYLWKYQVENN